MSARGLYDAVLTALGTATALGGRVFEEDASGLSVAGVNAIVREFEGSYGLPEVGSIGSANEPGSYRVPVDVYIPKTFTRTQFKVGVDAVAAALSPGALVGPLRPVVTVNKDTILTVQSAGCDEEGYNRVRLVVAATEYS